MGRIKKNITDEQKRLANSISSNNYYWKHKNKCDEEARERYRRNLQNNKPKL
jgi:hypothetical protein